MKTEFNLSKEARQKLFNFYKDDLAVLLLDADFNEMLGIIRPEVEQYAKEQLSLPVKLLEMATCPNCDGSGAIGRHITVPRMRQIDDVGNYELVPEQDVEWEQCQWCAERQMIIDQWKQEGGKQ